MSSTLGGEVGTTEGTTTNIGSGVDTAITTADSINDAGNGVGTGSLDGGTDAETGIALPQWLTGIEGVDSNLAIDPSLKAIQDVPSLIKSYVHAQRKMGADKFTVPNENSTQEEWLQTYHKLGLPTDFGEYDLAKGEEAMVDDTFFDEFRQTAFDNNIMPNQAQALYDFMNSKAKMEYKTIQDKEANKYTEEMVGLEEEWGEGFKQKVHQAKIAVHEFGGDELKSYLNESGLGNDPKLIRAFQKIGETFFKEAKHHGESAPAYSLSAGDAMEKANKIMGDFDGAYYNSMHPDHKRVVDEVNKLFQVSSTKSAQ